MNDEGIPTPRNLPDRNQPGSGALPEQKKSMDGAMHAQTADGKEMLEHVQSATQSQQFKTLEDSKTQLHEDTAQEIGLRQNLQQTSQSDNLKADSLNEQVPEEANAPDDVNRLNFNEDISNQGIPIENEVIPEQDEHDEEERKTQTEHFKKLNEQNRASQPNVSELQQNSQNLNKSGPSTV